MAWNKNVNWAAIHEVISELEKPTDQSKDTLLKLFITGCETGSTFIRYQINVAQQTYEPVYELIATRVYAKYGPFQLPSIRSRTLEAIIYNYFYAKNRDIYNCNSTGSLYFKGDTLYSYGPYFKLCVRAKNCFVINADRYTISTSKHQSMAIARSPPGTPQIPYSALTAAGISPKEIYLIEKTEDRWEEKRVKDPKTGEHKIVKIHHLGSALFRDKVGNYWLSALDFVGVRVPQYFLVQLPKKAKSVAEAYRILAPLSDEEWIRYELGEIKRQGEFFFVPCFETWSEIKRELNLPSKEAIQKYVNLAELFGNPNGNPHTATNCIITKHNEVYVSGTVRHPQHKTLKLGQVWHQVRINTAKASYSASGRVD